MIHKLFYQKSITIAGFQKMQIDRERHWNNENIYRRSISTIGFHLVVNLRILLVFTKRKLNVFFFSNLNLNP